MFVGQFEKAICICLVCFGGGGDGGEGRETRQETDGKS